ncbi:MAG TPA: hypothetical protein PLH60_09055 [Proteiniphilum sp.]|nr:hypothetical protein [Proteiniphilum sp.]HPJ50691.1 hypothetical protein [Proteiniphilum sp.]HPR20686.1 hypothetical protein [Proteiniphilum sp.]
MTKELLYKWMDDPGNMDDTSLQVVEKVVEEYPFFPTSRMLLTKSLELHISDRFEEELARTAVLCSDRRQLLYLIRHEKYAHFLTNHAEDKEQTEDRTETLLDSFLSTLSMETNELSLSDDYLQVAGTDYFAYLESLGETDKQVDTESQPFQHQGIIDAFIEKAETDDLFTSSEQAPRERRLENRNDEDGGEFLTETLARIYIKQHKYEQALTIIKRLSLNFPKKSVYFADQIRFLELLIANEKNKNK